MRVESYSGGRADESPRRVTSDDGAFQIVSVLNRTVVQTIGRETVRRYRVLLDDKRIVDLIHDEHDEWYVEEA